MAVGYPLDTVKVLTDIIFKQASPEGENLLLTNEMCFNFSNRCCSFGTGSVANAGCEKSYLPWNFPLPADYRAARVGMSP